MKGFVVMSSNVPDYRAAILLNRMTLTCPEPEIAIGQVEAH